MCSFSRSAVCAVLVAYSSLGLAQAEKSLYGLQLRSKFALAECPVSPKIVVESGRILSPNDKYVVQPADAEPCFQHRFYESVPNPEIEKNAVVRVIWPLNAYPEVSRFSNAGVLVLDGTIHRVWFWTRGLKFQQDDLARLIDKFGKPTKVDRKNLQNAFGASFESMSASWDLGDSVVSFESYTDDINTGMLVLETNEGAEAYRARLNARKPAGQKM